MRFLSVLICVCVFAGGALAMGGAPPENGETVKEEVRVVVGDKFKIDDFESGSIKSPRDWWTFDLATAKAARNDDLAIRGGEIAGEVGQYSFLLQGDAKNWYAGGVGTYIARENQDISSFNAIRMDIYGNGPGSGTLKVEFYDDDNDNWQVEQNRAKNYVPLYDDKFVYDIIVDWKGWKRVSVMLDDFVDDNPEVGDDIWNPSQKGGSGGLLQLQFICLAVEEKGKINFNVDNIYLTASEE